MKMVKLKMTKEFSVNKTKLATIALILTITISATIIALPAATAQEQTYDFPTYLFVSVAPNPVGVDQLVYVTATFSRPTPTAEGYGGDWYENVTIEMVDPDGEKTEYGPYLTGMVGGVTINFVPNQVGEYTFQAFYPGETLDLTNPTDRNPNRGWNRHLIGSRLLPTESEIMTLTVQEDPVEPIYQTPSLPDEYWTRPIYATNWAWAEVGANWFSIGGSGKYDATGNLQPYGTAPNTGHIMWTKYLEGFFGGQPGAPILGDQATQYSSTSGVATYYTPIIMNGILYYNKHYGDQFAIGGWEAVDIRTGEKVWSKPAGVTGQESLQFGQILRVHNEQEYGSWAYLYSSPTNLGWGAPSWRGIYDAKTCTLVANLTNAVSASFLMSCEDNTKGTLLGYYTSGGNLVMWNSSKIFSYEQEYMGFIIGRRTHTFGTHNWTEGVEWSVPLPTELDGNPISLSVGATTPEVILVRQLGGALANQGVNTEGWQITAGYDAKTGAKLWGPIKQTIPELEDVALLAARDGYYVLHSKDKFQAYGYSLTTGKKLWGPVQLEGNAWSASWRSADIAYGKVYIWDLGGWVQAIDLESGEVAWNFTRGSAGYDTPYGTYTIFGYNAHSIADGKLFLSEGVTYTPPLSPSRRLALNCTDGSLVWSTLNFNSKAVGAIADGYLVTWNCFDNQLYSFGKGPTETTVSIKTNVISQGSSVLIEGTVIDISAGSEQEGVIERFPHGLPAVADECMSEWMEYVYMQQIKPEDVEGVKVFVKILDPNGDWYSATVTTDRNGRFSHMWAPAIVGEYKVTAMFEGSESYYASQETTTFGVDEAQAAEDVPSAEEIADATANKLPAYQAPEMPAYLTIDLVILIIAAVGVVIGLVAYMALRKQQ
jgi:hypothetical protein